MEGNSDRSRWIALAALVLAGVAIAVAIASGCGDGAGETTTAAAEADGCERVAAPKPKRISFPAAPRQIVSHDEKLTAVVETSCGTFEIALDAKRAPKTVNSFVVLAQRGFYDGLAFHRIIPGFVIQSGDPLGNGSSGPGYSVDEKPPPNLAYTKGVVAMAKSPVEPPGRFGSQFFVVLGADAALTPEYALVGKVVEGFDVVERIGELGTPQGTPTDTAVIEGISIEEAAG